ncbi:hypothetical protein GF326_01780 [Candidatus Bathyarchaeota archaeon]|nr:hypothetical protein [Candidatus Bathyarchaeota archaeon]
MEEKRMDAFLAIREAEEAGANVTGLVEDFNIALDYIASGEPENISEAELIFDEIMLESMELEASATREENYEAVVAIVKVLVLLALAIIIWLHGENWFWSLWRRTREGYVVQ